MMEKREIPQGSEPSLEGDSFRTDEFDSVRPNPFKTASLDPLSTFSIDVDTASYALVRQYLNRAILPPKGGIRIEELINYFPYDYARPANKEEPFKILVDATTAPWKAEHALVRIAVQGYEIKWQDRPSSNLVFLVDSSGSMQPENRLPLVKKALSHLISRLDERDRVAVVTYSGSSRLVLPSTTANNQDTIRFAVQSLQAGGSTQGSAGIQDAYRIAQEHFIPGANNRVILCTDGDFNVGITNRSDLVEFIQKKAAKGVFLSIFGFGMGNYKDGTLEELSNKGNGNYGFIDSEREAIKVFSEQIAGTLITIAKDVKIQVEFNPAVVDSYRLIGYENRMLAAEDFNDDRKDAGEVGAGASVTALYEVVPVGSGSDPVPSVDPLKYQERGMTIASTEEMLTVKVRYKAPDGDTSKLMEQVLP
jgi:Ca-activated chloride channel homolog